VRHQTREIGPEFSVWIGEVMEDLYGKREPGRGQPVKLAVALGIHPGTIYNWLSARTVPDTREHIKVLSKVSGRPAEEVLRYVTKSLYGIWLGAPGSGKKNGARSS